MDARVLHRILLVSLIVGFGFSLFSAFEVLDPALQSSCSAGPFFSCGAVDRSGHTSIGPIPDYAVGIGGFLAMLAVDVPLFRTYDGRLLYAMLGLTSLGLVIAIGLGVVELTIIHALCPICLGAYLSDLGAFVATVLLVRLRRSTSREAAHPAEAGAAD